MAGKVDKVNRLTDELQALRKRQGAASQGSGDSSDDDHAFESLSDSEDEDDRPDDDRDKPLRRRGLNQSATFQNDLRPRRNAIAFVVAPKARRAQSASCSWRRVLLMPQAHPGPLYRCGKRD